MKAHNLDAAVALIETELTNWTWEFGWIQNPQHALRPFGAGLSLTLYGYGAADGLRVWEKGTGDALELAGRAIDRALRRESDEASA